VSFPRVVDTSVDVKSVQQIATVPATRLAQHWTTRHRCIHWQVACMTQSMPACWWRIFWTHAVIL